MKCKVAASFFRAQFGKVSSFGGKKSNLQIRKLWICTNIHVALNFKLTTLSIFPKSERVLLVRDVVGKVRLKHKRLSDWQWKNNYCLWKIWDSVKKTVVSTCLQCLNVAHHWTLSLNFSEGFSTINQLTNIRSWDLYAKENDVIVFFCKQRIGIIQNVAIRIFLF